MDLPHVATEEELNQILFSSKFIAVLDILGFKEMVKHNSSNHLGFLYKTFFNEPIKEYNEYRKGDERLSKLNIINVSDALYLWTENSKHGSIVDLVRAVKLFLGMSMVFGIPLRGAITKGDFDVFNNDGSISIVGKPLLKALDLEKVQKWSGCIIDQSIGKFFEQFDEILGSQRGVNSLKALQPEMVVQYDQIPINDSFEKGYAINWLHNDEITEKTIRNGFKAHSKYEKECASVEIKIDNTIAFFKHCKLLREKYRM